MVLDILFVGVFRRGVSSVALATIISQGISAAMCMVQLCRTSESYRVFITEIQIDREAFGEILHHGVPSGLQNGVIAFSNVIIQAAINLFGTAAIAGCGVAARLEGFALLPIMSFAMALSTFVAQNKGAGSHGRIRKGARLGILWCTGLAAVTGFVLFLAVPWLSAGFNGQTEVIAYSTLRTRMMAPFYLLLGASNCIGGILLGAGKTKSSMAIYLICWSVVRVIVIRTGIRLLPDIRLVFAAYPLTWALSTVAFGVCCRRELKRCPA